MGLQVISYNNNDNPAGLLTAILPLLINIETKEISLTIDPSLIIKEGKLSIVTPIPSIEGHVGKSLLTDGLTVYWGNLEGPSSYTQKEIDNFFSGITPIVGYNNTYWDAAYKHSIITFGDVHGISVDDLIYGLKDNLFTGLNDFQGETHMISLDFQTQVENPNAIPLVYILPTYMEGRVFYNKEEDSLSLYNSDITKPQVISLKGHKHYQLYQPDGTNPFVYTSNDGKLHIDGSIVQSGVNYETHAEQVYTQKDYIILRDGAIAGLANGAYAGFLAKLYDGVNDGHLVFDNAGIARVGDVGNEQPIATRIETPTNGQFAYWDSANTRLNFKALLSSDIPALNYLPLSGGTLTGALTVNGEIKSSVTSASVSYTAYSPGNGYPRGQMLIDYNNLQAVNIGFSIAPAFGAPSTFTRTLMQIDNNKVSTNAGYRSLVLVQDSITFASIATVGGNNGNGGGTPLKFSTKTYIGNNSGLVINNDTNQTVNIGTDVLSSTNQLNVIARTGMSAAYFEGNVSVLGNLTTSSFIKTGGTAAQFLKADGSSDATVYSVTTHTHQDLVTTQQQPDLNTYTVALTLNYKQILQASLNIFPVDNNANSVLTISTYTDSNYAHQLGFSGYGDIYQRYKSAGNWSPSWYKVFTEKNFNLTSVPITASTVTSANGFYIGANNINTANILTNVCYKNQNNNFSTSQSISGMITATQHNISALNTAPASATATGVLGEIRVTATYIYVCTNANTWVRSALTTW